MLAFKPMSRPHAKNKKKYQVARSSAVAQQVYCLGQCIESHALDFTQGLEGLEQTALEVEPAFQEDADEDPLGFGGGLADSV